MAEVAHVGVERLGAGDGEDDRAEGDEGDAEVVAEELDAVLGGERLDDARVVEDAGEAGDGDDREPDDHHRAEDAADLVGAEALGAEEEDEDRDRQRDDDRLQARHRDLHPFDRGEDRDRRGDDAVAVEQRDAEQADRDQRRLDPGAAQRRPHDQGDQGEDAALAVVVGAHDEDDELDRDDQRDRPEDERDDAVDVGFGRLHRVVVGGEDGLQGVQRAGADVAEDDAEGAEGERRHAELAAAGARRRRGGGGGHAEGTIRPGGSAPCTAAGDGRRRSVQVADGVFEDLADVGGLVEDLGVAEAQRAQAAAGVGLVAPHVDRLVGGGAVVGEAVGLDDEAERGPVEVDAVAAEVGLGGRRGQAGGAGDRQEAALERGLGAAEGLGGEDAAQAATARAPGLGVEERRQAVGGDEPEPVGLVDRVFDAVGREAGGEVDEDRDRVVDGDRALEEAGRFEARAAVDLHFGAARAGGGGHGDFDRALRPLPNPPQLGTAAVAQSGSGTTDKDGGDQLGGPVDLRTSHGVDAAVQLVQASRVEAVADGVG